MPVTLRQIAEKSGVSLQTVSQILRGEKGSYRQETRDLVSQTALELGYLPNAAARATRDGYIHCVALVLSETAHFSLLDRELLDGIEGTLAQHKHHLLVSRLPETFIGDGSNLPTSLREVMARGFLINYNTEIPPVLVKALQVQNIPSIWINSRQEGVHCVFPDDIRAAQEATEHLLMLGHSRIAYVSYADEDHYSKIDRRTGYAAAMRRAHLAADYRSVPNMTVDSGELIRDWLAEHDSPTALLCYSPQVAQHVLCSASLAHFRVPEDLSVMTFASHGRETYPYECDFMKIPQKRIGIEAAQMLMCALESLPDTLLVKPISLERVGGWTTAPPPKTV